MKKFFILFLITCFTYVSAQDYTPLIKDNMKWLVEFSEYEPGYGQSYEDVEFKIMDEFMEFNGKEYRSVHKRRRFRPIGYPASEWTNWSLDFYLAENINERKVYVYYPEPIYPPSISGEFLLYDFSLQPGDVVPVDGYRMDGETAIVTEITYENVFDEENVKTWNVHFPWDDGTQLDFKIYEGIGASSGLIYLDIQMDVGVQLIGHHQAMGTKDILSPKISVYPNPFTNRIFIENNQFIKQYQLFDLSGNEILRKSNLEDVNKELESLTPGNYILRLIDKNNRSESVKLIKK